jgi:hypothetical protein
MTLIAVDVLLHVFVAAACLCYCRRACARTFGVGAGAYAEVRGEMSTHSGAGSPTLTGAGRDAGSGGDHEEGTAEEGKRGDPATPSPLHAPLQSATI